MAAATDNIVSALKSMAEPGKAHSPSVRVLTRNRPISAQEQFEDDQVSAAMRVVATDSPLSMARINGPQMIHARYDSAHYTEDNRRYYLMADGMAADAAMNVGVREVLRILLASQRLLTFLDRLLAVGDFAVLLRELLLVCLAGGLDDGSRQRLGEFDLRLALWADDGWLGVHAIPFSLE
jgi:hypothetical protein